MSARKIIQPFWVSDAPLSEDDFQQLEAAGDVGFGPEARQAIAHNVAQYRQDTAMRAAAVRPSQIEGPLSRINKAAADLRRAIARVPPNQGAAVRELVKQAALTQHVTLSIDSLRRTLTEIEKYSAAALASLPANIGREDDPYIEPFLTCMHSIFEAAGGEGIYTEQSLSFLEAALRLAGGQLQSRKALEQRLKQGRATLVGSPPN